MVANMTWLTLLNICVTNEHRYVRNHNLFLSSFMKYHRVCNKSNTTGVTGGAGTAYYLGAPEFTSGFSGIVVARWLIFFIVFCRLMLFLCNIFCCCYVIVCLYSIYGFVFPFWYLHIIFFVCCNSNLALSAFMAYRLVCNNSSMTVLLEEQELLPFRSTCIHRQI
jgi:hypothetical protein